MISLILDLSSWIKRQKDKKMDQPPQAKKAKVKTSTVDLPIENQLLWQIDREMLNLYIENEVVILSLLEQ